MCAFCSFPEQPLPVPLPACLQVARRHDQSDAEGILLRAGAADPDANQWPGARRVNLPGNGAAAAQPAAQAAAASSSKAASGAADEGAADEAAAAQPHALPHVAVAPAGGEEDEGSLSSEEEEVMTSTAAAAEEAVAAFTAAVAAAEAAEAAAEEAEGMPGPEAAERATAFRREAEAAIVAAAAAAVVAGDSLDDVLPPRYEAPSSEPDAGEWARAGQAAGQRGGRKLPVCMSLDLHGAPWPAPAALRYAALLRLAPPCPLSLPTGPSPPAAPLQSRTRWRRCRRCPTCQSPPPLSPLCAAATARRCLSIFRTLPLWLPRRRPPKRQPLKQTRPRKMAPPPPPPPRVRTLRATALPARAAPRLLPPAGCGALFGRRTPGQERVGLPC